MRIGILSFGGREREAAVADYLRTSDVDVVTAAPERGPVTEGKAAAEDGARLQRADCDGVALFIEKGAAAGHVAEAALQIGGPLLLAGEFDAPLFDAAGALAEIGVHFDRLVLHDPELSARAVADWANVHRKQERQRGHEAAMKLYGQRFAVPAGRAADLDPVVWRRQFGVTVVPAGEPADFAAEDGDVNGALTLRLLRLVAGAEADVRTLELAAVPGIDLSSGEGATFARVGRRAGRYVCALIGGTREGNGQINLDCAPERVLLGLTAGRLHAASGEHFGALRAACEALDIEPLPLR